MPKRILVTDDDPSTCEFFVELLDDVGCVIETRQDPRAAIDLAASERFDVVVSDVNFEDTLSGIDVLKEVKRAHPDTEVVLISAFGTLDTAIEAVRLGAFDFVSKPFDVEGVRQTIRRALSARSSEPSAESEKPAQRREPEDTLIGASAKMLSVYKSIALVAESKTTVLIQGESGTGKELVARAIHGKGPRARAPFLAVNCGALTETLLESELFGYVRGAFTGAAADKEGFLHAARGGTLFLDEISETSPALQVKLLRVLQQEEYTPVGGTKSLATDVRVIAASNQNLESLVAEGRFRKDLYYRLNVVTIVVPPLRGRPEDIPKLIAHFVRRMRAVSAPRLSARALDRLIAYPWPGNVRELENTIERLALFSRGRTIEAEDLPEKFREAKPKVEESLFEGLPTLDEIEKRYLVHVLGRVEGNRTRAAEILGIDRRTLYRMLERFGIGDRDPGDAPDPS
ncbi:MAG TPA: sigma-54 dependent transcriptional regulator [Vicinamibacteria bacterium]|nr:sigma-54 dependent transcriptional regulator [Vicinamibacteria bacterium]